MANSVTSIDLIRALMDASTDAKLAGVRIKEFKVTWDEFIELDSFLSRMSGRPWSKRPLIVGIPVRRPRCPIA